MRAESDADGLGKGVQEIGKVRVVQEIELVLRWRSSACSSGSGASCSACASRWSRPSQRPHLSNRLDAEHRHAPALEIGLPLERHDRQQPRGPRITERGLVVVGDDAGQNAIDRCHPDSGALHLGAVGPTANHCEPTVVEVTEHKASAAGEGRELRCVVNHYRFTVLGIRLAVL